MEIEILACVPKEIREILKGEMTGRVIMVNSSGVYLCFDEQVVFLCDITWGLVPIGIAVDGFKKMAKHLCLEDGQQVTYKDNTLIFSNGTVHLLIEQTNPEKNCIRQPEKERLRQPEKRYIKQAASEIVALQKKHGISMLVEPLILGKKADNAIQLNPYCAKIYPYLVRLINAFGNGAVGEIRYCVDKILGLGTGLTPSADDVMLGMLYVFRKLPQKCPLAVYAFSESILELCDTHTNKVSSAYLKAIIQGAYFERMEQVWNGLCGMEPLDILKLTQVGSNSGTEMLLGMLITLRICGYDVSV